MTLIYIPQLLPRFSKALPRITLNKFFSTFFLFFLNDISIYSCGLELLPCVECVNEKLEGKLYTFIHTFSSAPKKIHLLKYVRNTRETPTI